MPGGCKKMQADSEKIPEGCPKVPGGYRKTAGRGSDAGRGWPRKARGRTGRCLRDMRNGDCEKELSKKSREKRLMTGRLGRPLAERMTAGKTCSHACQSPDMPCGQKRGTPGIHAGNTTGTSDAGAEQTPTDNYNNLLTTSLQPPDNLPAFRRPLQQGIPTT